MDVLRDLIAEWKAGRNGADVAKAASEALDVVCARLERVRARFPHLPIDLGDDVRALLRLCGRGQVSAPRRLSVGLSRAAIL